MRMEDVLGNDYRRELIEASEAADGRFCAGKNGVEAIYTPADQKVDFIVYANHVDCHVRSSLGYPAVYPLRRPCCHLPARAVLMDLDGTSVHSESFWIWIIQQSVALLLDNPRFPWKMPICPLFPVTRYRSICSTA